MFEKRRALGSTARTASEQQLVLQSPPEEAGRSSRGSRPGPDDDSEHPPVLCRNLPAAHPTPPGPDRVQHFSLVPTSAISPSSALPIVGVPRLIASKLAARGGGIVGKPAPFGGRGVVRVVAGGRNQAAVVNGVAL